MAYSKNKWKVTVPTRQDGQVGIRATLNNMGFSDDAIGYDRGQSDGDIKRKKSDEARIYGRKCPGYRMQKTAISKKA